MAPGAALTLAGALLLPPGPCEFWVRGTREPQTELLRLVDLYRAGGVPLSDISRLSVKDSKEFRERVVEVRNMIRRGLSETLEPGDSCIQAASLLEMELAMSLAKDARWEVADSFFDEAWQVSFLMDEHIDQWRFQRDWLLATGLFHHELVFVNAPSNAFWRADRYFQNAIQRYPDDAEVLLAAGALLEWAGSLPGGHPSHLNEAEELYARALRLTPGDLAILVRHGWVLEKLGRNDEAERAFLRILELGAAEDVLYRSRMGLGRIAEAAGRLDDAVAYYETASSTIPSWQVAHIALGHALHASGSHDRARAVLARALTIDRLSADETFGGWWSYELGLTLRLEPLLERMRAEVRQ
jgi:tetratricopeptide (TPR) repeat protein